MKNAELKPLIVVKNLSFQYDAKSKNATDNISFEIFAGETIAFVGHNGSGKSTLAKLLAGILEHKNGEIIIDGIETNSDKASELAGRIGIVFQNPDNQFIGSSVEDDVAFGLENKKIKREEMDPIIDRVLEEVNMSDMRKREPVQLSGGQKQRIAIAGVLALDSDILILDESTSMLDPQGKKEISVVLENLKKEHPEKTIIKITHDLEETLDADRVFVFNAGKIVISGKPSEVFKKEDELRAININVPFFYRISNRLIKDGYIKEYFNSLEELARFLNENRI